MSIIGTALKVAGVTFGVGAAIDVARYIRDGGDGPREGAPHPSVTGWLYSNRHAIGFAATNILHPMRIADIHDAVRDAEAGAKELFPVRRGQRGTDNVQDAYRHVLGSADATYRLIVEHDMSESDAAAFVREAGEAHEADSLLEGQHRESARTMDIHNNDVGIAIGIEQARMAAAGNTVDLSQAVLDSLRGGEALITDGAPSYSLRPATDIDVSAAHR